MSGERQVKVEAGDVFLNTGQLRRMNIFLKPGN